MTSTGVAPPDGLRFKRKTRLIDCLREIWKLSALTPALAEREIRAAYKQAALGIAWAIVSPVTLMIVFTVFFQRVTTVTTNGAPYALFTYLGLVPWNFFSTTLSSGGMSIVNQMALVNKIRCPREVFPLVVDDRVGLQLDHRHRGAARAVPHQLDGTEADVVLGGGATRRPARVHHGLRPAGVGHHGLPARPPPRAADPPAARPVRRRRSPTGCRPSPTTSRFCTSIINPLAACIDAYRRLRALRQRAELVAARPGRHVERRHLLRSPSRFFRRLEVGFADVA